jgi:hypothetical protein
MKKAIFTLASLFLLASVPAIAQDDKKQESKKEEKKEVTKEEKKEGGTRMAINEKGVPNKKKNPNTNTSNNSTKPGDNKTGDSKK